MTITVILSKIVADFGIAISESETCRLLKKCRHQVTVKLN